MDKKIQHYCLQWHNHHNDVAEVFLQLLQADSMVDVTLCAEGRSLYAHRMILSICSPFFQEILLSASDIHPVIILSDISFIDIQCIIEFIYRGELNVSGVEQFMSVLKVAEELRIKGLMEVINHFPELNNTSSTISQEQVIIAEECLDPSDTSVPVEEISGNSHGSSSVFESQGKVKFPVSFIGENLTEEDRNEINSKTDSSHKLTEEEDKKRKRRKDTCKKEYSEESMEAALGDIRVGRPLVETATAHNIPRSTLYRRARSQGVIPTMIRHEHTGDNVLAAVRAVTGGASLQQAADLFKIPKTVLWRRVRKVGGGGILSRRAKIKQVLNQEKWQLAIQALEQGQSLSSVATMFQIPKKLLYREKVRLVESGLLPTTSLRKSNFSSDTCKQLRLREAVIACQQGKMSQAAASATYQVPKTSIWRRLQQEAQDANNKDSKPGDKPNVAIAHLQEQSEFSFHDVTGQIPVAYIDESAFHETSLIILTTDIDSRIELQEQSKT